MTEDLNNEEDLLHLRKQARRRLVGAVVLVIAAIIVLWNVLDNEPPAKLLANRNVVVTTQNTGPSAAQTASAPQAPVSPAAPSVVASAPVASVPAALPDASAATALPADALPGTLTRSPAAAGPVPHDTDRVKTEQPKKIEQPKKTEAPGKTGAPGKPKVDPQRILDGLDDVDTSPKKTAAAVSTAEKSNVKYSIQVAAYSDAAKAQSVVSKLKAMGVRVSSEKVKTDKGEFTRVRVGPYASKSDAEAALKKMQAQGINGILVAK